MSEKHQTKAEHGKVDEPEVDAEKVVEAEKDEAAPPDIPTHDEAKTVRLFRTSRDGTPPSYTMVHPDMVGDYMRAGWCPVFF